MAGDGSGGVAVATDHTTKQGECLTPGAKNRTLADRTRDAGPIPTGSVPPDQAICPDAREKQEFRRTARPHGSQTRRQPQPRREPKSSGPQH